MTSLNIRKRDRSRLMGSATATPQFFSHGRQRDRSRLRIGLPAVLAATVAGLAACSSGGGSDPASFTVAVIEPDITTVPILAALDVLREDGYEIEVVELAEPELAIEGLASGEYAISAEATSPALIAIEQDAPIRIIADVVGNQWAIYATEGIAECDDLAGRPFGIFSEGAVATAMVRDWVAQNCSEGSEPEYLTIGGSDVRAQALISGQIDATALELGDVVALAAAGETSFVEVVNFADGLADVHPQTVYANNDFLQDNAEAAQAFVTALLEEHDKVNADPDYLVELVDEHLPDGSDDVVAETARQYVEAGLFDAGAIDEENMQGTIDFFVRAGVIGEGMTVEDAVDLSFLESARG